MIYLIGYVIGCTVTFVGVAYSLSRDDARNRRDPKDTTMLNAVGSLLAGLVWPLTWVMVVVAALVSHISEKAWRDVERSKANKTPNPLPSAFYPQPQDRTEPPTKLAPPK